MLRQHLPHTAIFSALPVSAFSTNLPKRVLCSFLQPLLLNQPLGFCLIYTWKRFSLDTTSFRITLQLQVSHLLLFGSINIPMLFMLFDLKASISALIWDTGQVWRRGICFGSSSSILSSSIGWSSTLSQPEQSQYSHPSGSYLDYQKVVQICKIFGKNVPLLKRLLFVHTRNPVIQKPGICHHPPTATCNFLQRSPHEAVASFTWRRQSGTSWRSFPVGFEWALFALVGVSRFSFKSISKPKVYCRVEIYC